MVPRTEVTANKAINLELKFKGIADYNIGEYKKNTAGDWELAKAVKTHGSSEDPQHDAFKISPVVAGAENEMLLLVTAQMRSVTGEGTVRMVGILRHAADPIGDPLEDKDELTSQKPSADLALRTVLFAKAGT